MSHTCKHTAKRRPLVGVAGATLVASAVMATFGGNATAAGGTPYGGFSTAATGVALQVALFSPAIPIPVDPGMPQAELDLSYATVTGSSGPTATSMASSLWPGNAVGNGLPVILSSFGAPAALANNNYPVHVNAQYPGTPQSGAQEPIPGALSRVFSSDKKSQAIAGFSTSGQAAGANSGSSQDLLSAIKSGNLSALGDILVPKTSPETSNPLGLLSAVLSVGGMTSNTVTDYSDPSVVNATTTTEVGNVSLLGGLVKMSGIKVQSSTSSSLDGGAKAVQSVDYGTLTVAGQTFKLTDKGVVAAGSTTPVPIASVTQLAKLGISIEMPKPTQKVAGTSIVAAASGPVITIDTAPVLTLLKLDKLPLGDILDKLPSSADQLKSTLPGVLEANPKVVFTLGSAASSAETIAALDFPTEGGLGGAAAGDLSNLPDTSGTAPGDLSGVGSPGATNPPAATNPGNGGNAIQKVSDLPGLPPLGSIPGMLTFLGMILAGALAWLFRGAALAALGAGSTCTHGLTTGLPDLRKA